jgi:ankyrin repeat protein
MAHIQLSIKRFRWVEIWISILFPAVPTKQIKTKKHAQDLISSIGKAKDYESDNTDDSRYFQQLDEAYEKLWNTNKDDEHKDLQPRIFHLVLCAFEPLTLSQLTEALRIDPEVENSYDKELLPEYVEALFFNFLVKNSKDELEFAHESAKSYIIRVRGKGAASNTFSTIQNNLSMAKICLRLMTNIDHPAWRHAGVDLRQCQGMFRPQDLSAQIEEIFKQRVPHAEWRKEFLVRQGRSHKLLRILEPIFDGKSFAVYVSKYCIQHCRLVSKDETMFEQIFRSNFLMMTDQRSALTAVVFCLHYPMEVLNEYSRRYGGRRFEIIRQSRNGVEDVSAELFETTHIFGLDAGNLTLLPSHFLAMTDLITDNLVSNALAQPTPMLDDLDLTMLYPRPHLVSNTAGDTALLVACRNNSNAAAKFFLELELKMNEGSHSALLFAQDRSGALPIHVAAAKGLSTLVGSLLSFEAKFASRASAYEDDNSRKSDEKGQMLLYTPNKHGELPVDLAVASNRVKALRTMLEFEASYQVSQSSTRNLDGHRGSGQKSMLFMSAGTRLPIHDAALHGFRELTELMLEFEAHYANAPFPPPDDGSTQTYLMSSKDVLDYTPFELAVMRGKYEEDGLIWLLDRYRICLTSYLENSIGDIRFERAMQERKYDGNPLLVHMGGGNEISYSYSELLLQRLENLPPED